MKNRMNLKASNKILNIMIQIWAIMLKPSHKKIRLLNDMTKPVQIMKMQSSKNLRH